MLLIADFFVMMAVSLADPLLLAGAVIAGCVSWDHSGRAALSGAVIGMALTALAHALAIQVQSPFPLMHYPAGMLAGVIPALAACRIWRRLRKRWEPDEGDSSGPYA